jgi:hypothetical protein
VGVRLSAPVQTGPGVHSASCTMGTGSFTVVKSGRSVTLTPHPLLVPWSRKSRAIPLLPLWAVRPVLYLPFNALRMSWSCNFYFRFHDNSQCYGIFAVSLCLGRCTRWRSWLRQCATIRKVAGSIPDGVIGSFH